MAKAREVLSHVHEFLRDEHSSLESLEDWSADYLHNVYRKGDEEDRQAIHVVRSILNAFEDSGESEIRRELAAAIRPFEQKVPKPSSSTSFVFLGEGRVEKFYIAASGNQNDFRVLYMGLADNSTIGWMSASNNSPMDRIPPQREQASWANAFTSAAPVQS